MSAVEQAELVETQQNQESGAVTAQDAGRLLGIGHAKLSRLLRDWERTGHGLPFRRSRLDQRAILICRRDIAALREQSQGVSVHEAMRRLGVSRQKMKQLVESGELPLRENPLHQNKRLVDPERYAALLAERIELHPDRAGEEGTYGG
jgi:predicted DNA-binding protein (UPF0251 family)